MTSSFNGAVGNTLIRRFADRNEIPVKSLYTAQPVVVLFLRRWGCVMCRGYAKKMQSELGPILRANGVRLSALGMEKLGVEDFVAAGYFDGDELYVDEGRKLYKALNIKRMNALTGIAAMIGSSSRAWLTEVQKMGVTGNLLEGDGFQLGATFIVGTSGDVWLEHRQKDFGDHPTPQTILDALKKNIPGFDETKKAPAASSAPTLVTEAKTETPNKAPPMFIPSPPINQTEKKEALSEIPESTNNNKTTTDESPKRLPLNDACALAQCA